MKLFNILHLNKHKHVKQSDGSRLIKRRIIAALCFILICGLFMGITAIAMYAGNATSGNNVVRSGSFGLKLTVEKMNGNTVESTIVNNQSIAMGDPNYVINGSSLQSGATYRVTLSAEGQSVNGFCAVTVADNGTPAGSKSATRTRSFVTGNIPAGGSVTFTFVIVDNTDAQITFHPHWGSASNSAYSNYDGVLAAGSSTDVGVSGEAATFTHSDNLAHTDTYLYRVGNGNNVALGTLFKAATGTPNAANVKIKVESALGSGAASVYGTGTNLESGSTAQCNYSKHASDWTQSTLKFTGEGPVKVTISEGSGETYALNLEVVNGNNYTDGATLGSSANIVLLGNVKVGASSAQNSALTLSGKSVYGNGFEIDCTGNNISSKAFGIISLTDSTIDNAVVIGPTYTDYGASYGNDYYAATIVCYDNSVITNSRITNAKDPCCIYGTNVEIRDTILSGGLFANMQIRNRGGVTVNNLTTVNTQNGLGIVFYNATSDSYITINGSFTQHNFVANDATMSNSDANTLKSKIFSSTYSKYQFTSGSRKYVNTGIISMDDGIGAANITDNRADKKNYSGMTATFSVLSISVNGYVYTMENTDASMLETSYTEPAYTPSVQLPYPPVFSWSVPSGDNVAAGGDAHCYKDGSGVLQIQFLQGNSKTINATNYQTFKKYGATTAIAPDSITCVKKSSGASLTVTNGSVTFAEVGEYTITYHYNGVTVYDKDLGTTTTVNYTKTIKVNVAVKQNRPNATITSSSNSGTIAWGKAGTTFDPDYNPCIPFLDGLTITDYDANNNAYTVLDGSSQSSFISSIASVSVSGTTVTITLANNTKLVVKGPSVDGSVQIKANSNKLYYCDSTADNNPSAFTKSFTANSYTYTGENGVAVSYPTARSFTSTTSTSTIANYSSMTQPWTSNKFLMYDAQGGTVSPTYASSSPATLPTATREGYTLLNWNTKADGTGTARNAGASMSFSSSTTLYAIWAANVTVSFGGNGGTDPSPVSGGAGTTGTLPTSTLNGAWLEGWYTAETGGTKIGNPGASFTIPSSDTTYYAHWSPKYGVAYNANGGTCATEYDIYEGTALTLPTPTNGSKTFEGWFTAAEGGTKVGVGGDSYIPTAHIELFAQWSDNILVTFDGNGGTAGTNSDTYDHVTPITLPTATWAGHAFNGWYTAASGGTKVGNAGDSYVPTEPTTLHAQWTAYTVSFDGNGATNPSALSAGSNGSVTLPTPTRTGYTFNGWYTETSGGTKIGNGGASYTPTANITVHAQWTINNYKVTITTSNSSTAVTVNGTTVNSGGSVAYNSVVKVVLTYSESDNKTFTIKQGNTNVTRYSNEACTSSTTSTNAGTYYFKMPAGDVTINSSSESGGCVVKGTLITLADGTQKPIEELARGDYVLSYNSKTCAFEVDTINAIWNHGVDSYSVIDLVFSNSAQITVVNDHSFYLADSCEYVTISAENYIYYIGREFLTVDGESIVLVSAACEQRISTCYSLMTLNNNNAITNGIVSRTPDPFEGFFEIFETMFDDSIQLEADIAEYGLYDYSEWSEYISREDFDAFHAAYFKILVGKGIITEDRIFNLIELYRTE